MSEHSEASGVEAVMENISEKLHGHHSSSSSDEDEKPTIPSSLNRLFGRKKSVHKILGGGKTADLLLWRNKQMSASVLAGATVIWILFECMEYPLLTFICHVLILSLAILFIWINSAVFLKRSPPRIPEIVISEGACRSIASDLRAGVNGTLAMLHDISSGRDFKKFLLVVAGLWLLSLVGSCCNFLTLLYIGFVAAYTLPVLYERYETQVDSFAEKAMWKIKEQYRIFDAKVLSKIPRGPLKEKKHL
eukprot:Gb_36522 [translate_table: standard]